VTILTRYLIRAHAGPFAFAFCALTGLLFLTAIAQRFQELAGKAVGPAVILELMVLSLPHVITLTVPMAAFAATLYVFADLARSRELQGMAAAGMHPGRAITPLAVTGLVLSLLMVSFNDRVLPGANARFQDRLEDVARMSPALRLQPGVMNAVQGDDGVLRYILVRSLAREGDAMRGFISIDLSEPNRPQFLSSEHASMALRGNGRDVLLRLRDGHIASPFVDSPGSFRASRFQSAVINLRGLTAGLERGERVGQRAERELSMGTLRARIREMRTAAGSLGPGGSVGVSPADPPAYLVVGRYRGEIHRRYATAFACVVFVLLAALLGTRFAHGGMGAVIGLSVLVLAFFRVGIIWGDRLSDAGTVGPVVGNWGTVGVLLLAAMLLLRGVGDVAPGLP
jgi:lipopolysaccharide export system permease protein